jgi:hypothetical protein
MRKMVGRLAALAAAGALTFVGLPVASASAGTNGQHVNFCVRGTVTDTMLVGTNERGDKVYQGLPAENVPAFNISCSYSDLWWKGNVEVWMLRGDDWVLADTCWVPESMDGDYFVCR